MSVELQNRESVEQKIDTIIYKGNEININERCSMSNPFGITKYINLKEAKPVQWSVKRIIDLTFSLFGLILLMPLLSLIAVLIKIDSKGPALFKQKRTGLYGKDFYMYKFRTMREDAEDLLTNLLDKNESNDITMFKLTDDPRITKIGKILRKFSLDELPQLINIIKGEMSIIGPRPVPIREGGFDNYEKWHFLRYSTLPGVTGLWQISGRSDIKDFNRVAYLDCQYIQKWGLMLDFIIFLKTIPTILFTRGAV